MSSASDCKGVTFCRVVRRVVMRRFVLVFLLGLSLVALAFRGRVQTALAGIPSGERHRLVGRAAPELPRGLPALDGKDHRLAALRGQVVLLHFWTFGCSNCKRMVPRYNDWHTRFAARGLAVLGVHSPEFDWERERPRLAAFVREQHITHPTVVDDEMAAWDYYHVEAWPTAVVIDRGGVVRGVFVGDDQAPAIEAMLRALLAAEPR